MNTFFSHLPLLILIIGASWLMQLLTTWNMVAFVPAILLIALAITWTIPVSWPYITILILIAEMYTSLPPGFMTAALVIPLLTYRLRGRIEPDLSFSFLVLLGFTVLCQLIVIFSYDISPILLGAPVSWSMITQLPWTIFGGILVATTAVGYIGILFLMYLRPRTAHPIISLDAYTSHVRSTRRHY